jgi:hypothetical protein
LLALVWGALTVLSRSLLLEEKLKALFPLVRFNLIVIFRHYEGFVAELGRGIVSLETQILCYFFNTEHFEVLNPKENLVLRSRLDLRV